MSDAVRRRRSWNIFYLPLVTKIDLFIKRLDAFDASELERRRSISLPGGSASVATPEDILLRKLAWYREGGESSQTQWRDVLGVLRISRASFDHAYVDRWAAHLGVSDLWERARQS